MPADARHEGEGRSDPGPPVDLHALYLRRLAVHNEEVRRARETDAANLEAAEGIERLRLGGHEIPVPEPVPPSPKMLALKAACAAVQDGDDGPDARHFRRRRQDYIRVEMAMLAEYEDAISRRDRVRACLARAFAAPPADGVADQITQIRNETAQLRATNDRLRGRLLALGVDPDAQE